MEDKKTILEKVKALALSVIGSGDVQLATETVGEGEATLEAEAFEAGQPVFIVDGEERIPLPEGEYLLDSGMILVVAEEGMIAEMKSAEAAEESEENEEEVAQADRPSEKPLPKAIIESIVKETKFSKEEMDAKDAEILALKAQIEELGKTEVEVELSADDEVKPLNHNPESGEVNKAKFQFGSNRKLSAADRAALKIYNL